MVTVQWVRSALDDVASLWMSADSVGRAAVTAATHGIDKALRIDPHYAGESRSAGRRILLIPPLGVTFRVLDEDRVVRVLEVWQFKTRGA